MLKETMSDYVYRILKRKIISGVYGPGSKITETGMAKELEVSATPVREAFKRLSSEGFVESIPFKGIYVKYYTDHEVEQAYEARAKIEALAVKLFIERMTPKMISSLEAIMKTAEMESALHVYERVYSFHEFIILECQSDIVYRLLSSINAVIDVDRAIHMAKHVDDSQIIKEHQLLLDAIRNRDINTAQQRMERISISNYKCITS